MSICRRAAAYCLLPFAFCLLAGCGGSVTTDVPPKRVAPVEQRRDDPLEAARQVLAAAPDRGACATALQQVNAYLAAHPDRRAPQLTAGQKELLGKHFDLDGGEMAEVESPTYTLLDGPHLELCFLLRDVARSLDVEKLSPAEQAAAAFAWVSRQVIPHEGETDFPPQFIVRRGWGTGSERGRVFLALLHQLGIPGCFLMTPGVAQPWGCGALVEVEGAKEAQILVFDPRLGLPLPGPKGPAGAELARAYRLASPVLGPEDGRQIATLAALRKQPELLNVLTVDPKLPYDVTAEQVKDAAVRLSVPVSALAPRMRALQDDLFPQKLAVRLADDPEELIRRFGSAAGAGGSADSVRARGGAAGVLRRFVGSKEGGTDKAGLEPRAKLALIPDYALPRPVREMDDPDKRVYGYFATPFITWQFEPRMPRDLMLRGQLKEAAGQLTPLLEQLRIQKDRLQNDPDVYAKFDHWKDELLKAYGDLGRARDAARKGGPQEAADAAAVRVEQVWRNGQGVLSTLVDGSAAEPRRALATYLLALCLHEQAERLQGQADRLAHAAPPADAAEVTAAREAARGGWKDAAGWWNSYMQEFPGTIFSVHARLLHARAREATGNPGRARNLLEDTSGDMDNFAKVARLYLARRLQAP